jgi:hypothetical protein
LLARTDQASYKKAMPDYTHIRFLESTSNLRAMIFRNGGRELSLDGNEKERVPVKFKDHLLKVVAAHVKRYKPCGKPDYPDADSEFRSNREAATPTMKRMDAPFVTSILSGLTSTRLVNLSELEKKGKQGRHCAENRDGSKARPSMKPVKIERLHPGLEAQG